MQWWCSAQTAAWSWQWTAYPGVWAFVGLLGWLYWRLLRGRAAAAGGGPGGGARAGAKTGSGSPRGGVCEGLPGRSAGPDAGGRTAPLPATVPRWRVVSFAAGLLLVWAALDWPVGPLGAGYLASVHMAQVLVLSLVVPALLLLGIPDGAVRAWVRRTGVERVLRVLTHPVVALVVYNGVVVGTHVPLVLDTLSATQPGMLAMDLAWMGAGLVFWWPVLAPAPEREWFNPFFQMGYLFLNTIPVTVPYGFLVFADFPLYATYELAPPVAGLATLRDQRIAGLLMKVGGGVILWTAITVLFFRWWREEEATGADAQAPPSPGGAAG